MEAVLSLFPVSKSGRNSPEGLQFISIDSLIFHSCSLIYIFSLYYTAWFHLRKETFMHVPIRSGFLRWLAFCLLIAGFFSTASAQNDTASPGRVTVPWDEFRKIIRMDENEIVLPLETYNRLVSRASARLRPRPDETAWSCCPGPNSPASWRP
jgi:hypothetical protein